MYKGWSYLCLCSQWKSPNYEQYLYTGQTRVRLGEMQLQMPRMTSPAFLMRTLSCLLLLPGLLEATSLMKIKNAEGNAARSAVNLDSAQANDFLSNSRPKRNIDPKWYRNTPDFQSYYRYYSSIGHIEGLYEIDKLRMLYQQMRHLELVHGPDASSYQSVLGVLTTTSPPTTQPPPPPTTPAPTPNPLANAEVIYLCNPKDALCKPQIVYLPAGAVPVLCDPRYNPACRPKTEEEIKAAAPPPPPPPPPPAPTKSVPPPPPVIVIKGMEYDCDPYWDPDCLIDHPPRPVKEASAPAAPVEEKVVQEEVAPAEENVAPAEENAAPEDKKTPYPYFDPYDFTRDLYDPFRYANPVPDPEEK